MLEGKAKADKLLRGQIKKIDVIYTDTYKIAVANGYEGTIDEWLASLKGEKGDKGDPSEVDINDSVVSPDKTWSSKKISEEIGNVKNSIPETDELVRSVIAALPVYNGEVEPV